MKTILALDIGTSSVRAGLYQPDAEVLPETMVKQSRQLSATTDGGFEIDADLAFKQVVEAIDELYKRCDERIDSAVFGAISSFWHSIVGVDESGNPTTPVYAWAETRPASVVWQLRDDFDETLIHNRTGCPFHSSYWPAKLLWIRQTQEATFKSTAKWLSFPDFMGARLFGCDDTSSSMASGTGIFDLRKQTWDSELMNHLQINEEQLPKIDPGDSASLTFSEEYQERWPKMADVKWFPAVGDGAGNNVGAGCLTKSKAALMIGTSGAMRVVYKGDPPDQIPTGLWCYRVDNKRVVIGGALSDGGGLYRWLKDNFKISDDDDHTEVLISERAPVEHGITFLPFLAGERSTGYNDFASGAILGLRTAHDSVDVVQAALESVAYRFCEIFERLNSVLPIESIVASGGALRASPIWTQIICDVIGHDLTLPETREASSRGVVLLASEKSGLIEDIEVVDETDADEFVCNPSNSDAYKAGMKRHRALYKAIIESSIMTKSLNALFVMLLLCGFAVAQQEKACSENAGKSGNFQIINKNDFDIEIRSVEKDCSETNKLTVGAKRHIDVSAFSNQVYRVYQNMTDHFLANVRFEKGKSQYVLSGHEFIPIKLDQELCSRNGDPRVFYVKNAGVEDISVNFVKPDCSEVAGPTVQSGKATGGRSYANNVFKIYRKSDGKLLDRFIVRPGQRNYFFEAPQNDDATAGFLTTVNAFRERAGVGPLIIDRKLNDTCRWFVEFMSQNDTKRAGHLLTDFGIRKYPRDMNTPAQRLQKFGWNKRKSVDSAEATAVLRVDDPRKTGAYFATEWSASKTHFKPFYDLYRTKFERVGFAVSASPSDPNLKYGCAIFANV